MKKFDAALICAALAVLLLAFLFYPAKKLSFKKTTLTFSQWLKEDMPEDAVNKIIAEFEETNPAVKIVLEDKSRENIKNDCAVYLEAALNREGGGKKNNVRRPPDIILVDPLWLDDSGKNILFEPDGALSGNTTPLYSYFNALFYNAGILEDAGFDRPPKTLPQFEAFCKNLKVKNIYGLSISGDFFTDVFPWMCRQPDGEKDTFDFTGKDAAETMDFFNRLGADNMLGRPPFIKDAEEKIKNFTAGKTAMITASSKLIGYFKSHHSGLRFGITNIPYAENYAARPVFTMDSVHAAVLSAGAHSGDALEFTRFLAAKKADLAAAARAIPADGVSVMFSPMRTDAGQEYDAPSTDTLYAKARSLIENADGVDGWKLFSACASLYAIASEEFASMLSRSQTPADAAGNIKKRYASAH